MKDPIKLIKKSENRECDFIASWPGIGNVSLIITKYMKEEFGLNYRQIASILNRDERTIWGAYNSSKKDSCQRFFINHSKFYVPITIFKDRSLSVLETLTEYLKDTFNLRYCEIASLLGRDDRTIWTVYHRAKKKRKANKKNVMS